MTHNYNVTNHTNNNLMVLLLPLIIGITCLCSTLNAQSSDADISKKSEAALNQFETARAAGKTTLSIKHLLNYTELTKGDNDPKTIKVTHHYGRLLYQDGDYKQAIEVLKTALERSIVTHGPYGGEADLIYMDIGYAFSKKQSSLSVNAKYFDKALEVLRENGQHVSKKYIITLISIVSDMMKDNGLKGDYSTSIDNEFNDIDDTFGDINIEHEYNNYYHMAEKYIVEAAELAEKLKLEDEFLTSKIAIAMAKLKVMETADLAAVHFTVSGSISGATEKEYYDREDLRLKEAIKHLSKDTEKNSTYLTIANQIRMDIAWMRKDEQQMKGMCADNTLNMSDKYSPDRLYDIMEGGMVMAPELNMRISKNIFKALRTRVKDKKMKNGRSIRKPHFVPVCIDGELMAVLINAPAVYVKENR